jgi:hypothetical protein
MRAFIFILTLFFSLTAYADESSFENEKYSGYHKNDTCVMKQPYPNTKPDSCVFTDEKGCCSTLEDGGPYNVVSCYSYKRQLGSWTDKCTWKFQSFARNYKK